MGLHIATATRLASDGTAMPPNLRAGSIDVRLGR